MSMSTRSADTSVTFSLAELADLERARVDEEERARTRERARAAEARRLDEARRREEEVAAREASDRARAERVREEAIEKARAMARDESAREVARIEAEARTKLAADDAVRAHELAVLRVRTETGRRRIAIGLAAALALVVTIGGIGAVRASSRATGLETDVEHLRDGQASLMRERDAARSEAIATLDDRFARLRARPSAGASQVREARATAESARAALDPKTVEHARVRALSDALDAFEARLDAAARLEGLERRHDDLLALPNERRASRAIATAHEARASARLSDSAFTAYEHALDALRDALSERPGRVGPHPRPEPTPGDPCDPHDPLCGLDGRHL